MRVLGHSLGSEGSTLYETDMGQFFLYPHSQGGVLLMWDIFRDGEWLTYRSARHRSRAAALAAIERVLRLAPLFA